MVSTGKLQLAEFVVFIIYFSIVSKPLHFTVANNLKVNCVTPSSREFNIVYMKPSKNVLTVESIAVFRVDVAMA